MITDLTGKTADALKAKKLWLLDMDGTIYNENEILKEPWIFWRTSEKREDVIFSSPTTPPDPSPTM